MKRILAILLVLALCLTCFVGCGKDAKKGDDTKTTTTTQKAKTLAEAAKFLKAIHIEDAAETPVDYKLEGEVLGYNVEWSTDNEEITVTREDKWVTIGIPTGADATELTVCDAVDYKLTATISDGKGKSETVTFNRTIPAAIRGPQEMIVEEAYKLENGAYLEGTAILTGEVTMVKTPYDAGYGNITVIIQIGELADKRIECYRLSGEGCAELAVGDTITVIGKIKNYNNTIEYEQGCLLVNVVPGERVEAPADPKEIVEAAYALEAGTTLPYSATLTGKVIFIDTPYDSGYKNLSVTIVVDGCDDKPLLCYRLKGEGAELIKEGDIITVDGYITNYNGIIEYTAGCKLKGIASGEAEPSEPVEGDPTDPSEPVEGDPTEPVEGDPSYPEQGDPTDPSYPEQGDPTDPSYPEQGEPTDPSYPEQGEPTDPSYPEQGEPTDPSYPEQGEPTQETPNQSVVNPTEGNKTEATQQPSNGATTKPSTGASTGATTKPSIGASTKPSTGASTGATTKPSTGATTKPSTGASTGATTKPSTGASTKPSTGASTGATTKPSTGATTKPSTGATTKPSTGATTKPSTGATTKPSTAVTTKPSTGATTKPSTGATTKPTTQPTTKPTQSGKDPAADSLLSVKDAIALGLSKEHNTYTSGKYYVTGKIAEIYDTTWGNMKITATDGAGNPLTIYGSYDANGKYRFDDMKTQPKVGDTVKVYGIIGQFNNTPQMKNAWIVEINGKAQTTSPTTKPTTPAILTVVTDQAKILKDAAALGENECTPYIAQLTGKVLQIEKYDEKFGSVTLTFKVGDMTIECYQMKGDGANKVKAGDTITVKGVIKNYFYEGATKGKIEFAWHAESQTEVTMTNLVAAATQDLSTTEKILAAAFALKDGESLQKAVTLTGKVISVDTPYDASYDNVTVTFTVEGKNLKCYRLKGTGVDKVKEGDTITVTGTIKNFMGTIEFDNGCTLDKLVPGTVAQKEYKVVDAPKTGVAYKFGMVQGNVSSTTVYYLLGGMSGFYMATGSSATTAIDVYLESADGGYYMYAMINGKKQYINMVVNGTHVNGAYEATAKTVYTYDKDAKTLVAMMQAEDDEAPAAYWFGTRNDKTYTTVGPCKTEYEGFYCMFYEEK